MEVISWRACNLIHSSSAASVQEVAHPGSGGDDSLRTTAVAAHKHCSQTCSCLQGLCSELCMVKGSLLAFAVTGRETQMLVAQLEYRCIGWIGQGQCLPVLDSGKWPGHFNILCSVNDFGWARSYFAESTKNKAQNLLPLNTKTKSARLLVETCICLTST